MAMSNAPSSSGVGRVVSAGEGRPGGWRGASALLADIGRACLQRRSLRHRTGELLGL